MTQLVLPHEPSVCTTKTIEKSIQSQTADQGPQRPPVDPQERYVVERDATSPLTTEDERPRQSSTDCIRDLDEIRGRLPVGDARRANIERLKGDVVERERGFHALTRTLRRLF